MKLMRGLLTGTLLMLGILACGHPPRIHYYTLTPGQLAGASSSCGARECPPLVGVNTFAIDPPYDQDRIVYRVGSGTAEIGFYAYHRWAVPLETMLPQVVAAELDALADGVRVEPARPGTRYDVRLGGRLIALEEIDTAEGQTIRLRLRLTLYGPDGSPTWSELLEGESSTTADQVPAVIERMRGLLRETLAGAREPLVRRFGEL